MGRPKTPPTANPNDLTFSSVVLLVVYSDSPGGGQAWEFDLLATPFTVDAGFVEIPRGPGLGIEVMEERIAEHGDSWDPHPPPLWQLPDGSHCEW